MLNRTGVIQAQASQRKLSGLFPHVYFLYTLVDLLTGHKDEEGI